MTSGRSWSVLIGGLLGMLALLSSGQSWAQNQALLIEQLKFTAVELLIYTDQLQRFEGTRCRVSIVSNYDRQAAQQQLLSKLKPEHQSQFEQLFESNQVKQLLAENGAGIEAMLGPQQLLGGAASLSPKQRADCQELGVVFQDNYLQVQSDLQLLLERY